MDLTGLGALASGFAGQQQSNLIRQLQMEKERQALQAYQQQQAAQGAAAKDLLSLDQLQPTAPMPGQPSPPANPPPPPNPSLSQIAKDGPGALPRSGATSGTPGASAGAGGGAAQPQGQDALAVKNAFAVVDQTVPKDPTTQSARQLLVQMAQHINKTTGLDGPALFEAVHQQLALIQGVDQSIKNSAAYQLKMFEAQIKIQKEAFAEAAKTTQLAQGDRRLDQGDTRLDQGAQRLQIDIRGQDIRSADTRRGQDMAQDRFDVAESRRVSQFLDRMAATAGKASDAAKYRKLKNDIAAVEKQINDMRSPGSSVQPDNAKQDALIQKRDALYAQVDQLAAAGSGASVSTSAPQSTGAASSVPTSAPQKQPGQRTYASPDDVFKAIDDGSLPPEQGKKILIDKFGYTPQ